MPFASGWGGVWGRWWSSVSRVGPGSVDRGQLRPISCWRHHRERWTRAPDGLAGDAALATTARPGDRMGRPAMPVRRTRSPLRPPPRAGRFAMACPSRMVAALVPSPGSCSRSTMVRPGTPVGAPAGPVASPMATLGSTGPPTWTVPGCAANRPQPGMWLSTRSIVGRFRISPRLPSSSCWRISTTDRQKLGSIRSGVATRSCPLRLCSTRTSCHSPRDSCHQKPGLLIVPL